MERFVKQVIAALVVFAQPIVAPAQGIDQYFPESGVIRGEVMVMGASAELEALAQRMQGAMEANPEWFRSYIESAGSGALPYHENFGLTEREYERFLVLSESSLSLQRVGSVEITLKRTDAGVITFVAESADFPLHMVSISADQQYVETRFGRLSRTSDVDQQDPNAPTGRWSGPKWNREESAGSPPWAAQLSLGRRQDFGDGIIYYNALYLSEQAPERHQFVVLYPLP